MRSSPAVHVFAFADSAHPNLCTLASSVASAGGRLNVVGLGYEEEMPFGAVPREALDSIAEALAEQGKARQVEGQRMAATLQCMTKEDCKKTKGLKKVRKFFAVWPHLEHLEDEDLVLAMDGYDVVLETPSLEHLQDTFDHVQRRLGPVTSLPTGPVIFSGEANCWPFVHPWTESPFMTGDYRPNYLYRYDAGHALRGDEVCEHWRKHLGHPGKMPGHRFGRNRTEELPLFLPFLNSGVFMGRVASLRGLFALAAEVLRLFGDFADQALVTSTALHASLLERPWVPLRVDHTGELLASLHGVQLEALARRLKAPPVCNFPGRMACIPAFAASHEPSPGRSKWSSARLEAARREDRPPPLVVHFNGDKKPYFEENCHDSVSAEGQVLGSVPGQCSLMDTDHQIEAFITTPTATETRVHMRQAPSLLLARTPPHVARLLGISASLGLNTAGEVAGRLLSHGQSILVQRPGPPDLPELTWSASKTSSWRLGARRCLGEVELWQFDVRGPQDGKLPTPEHLQQAQGGHQALGAVLLDRESMACVNRPFQQDYCQMLWQLRASWSCLAPHGENSSGLMVAIYDPADFQASFAQEEEASNVQSATSSHLAAALRAAESRSARCSSSPPGVTELCPGQAAVDFATLMPPWEASRYTWTHFDGMGLFVLVKDPDAER
ncbi:Ank2, partial [Symbiodinium necroappetens]